MRVLICGDREWKNYLVIETFVGGLFSQYGEKLYIIEGDARGADKMAGEAALEFLPAENLLVYPANWEKYGKAAGPIRNKEMLDQEPDLVIAFHSDIENSKGTRNMVTISKSKGVPTYVVSKY